MKTLFNLDKHIPLFITYINKKQVNLIYNRCHEFEYYNIEENDLFIIPNDKVYMYIGEKDCNNQPIYTGHQLKIPILDYMEGYDPDEFITGIVAYQDNTIKLITENEKTIRQWKDGTNDWDSLENNEMWNSEIINHIELM